MYIKQNAFKHRILFILIAWLTFATGLLSADVIRDGTIGPGASVQPTGPDFLIPQSLGELRGSNLFHSFREFSLTQDQSATFSGAGNIHNIIGRVTGGNASHIDGLLRSAVPGANFYLLNPQGIIFGENARLDVQGAFHASTAGELRFSNGEIFNADVAAPPILSVASPEAFGFIGEGAASIELNGTTLKSAHDVALCGGTVVLRDGARIITAADDSRFTAKITLIAIERISFSGVGSDGSGSGLGLMSPCEELRHGDRPARARWFVLSGIVQWTGQDGLCWPVSATGARFPSGC